MGGAWRGVWEGGQGFGLGMLMLKREAVEILFQVGRQIKVGITCRIGQGEVSVGWKGAICS